MAHADKPSNSANAAPAPRTQRADARKNRERVLAAAEALFATRGVAATTEEVARAAGVGIGTVFRHFPTKEALLQEIIVNRMRRFADEAQALAADRDIDPGAAFFTLFSLAADHSMAKYAAAAALADAGIDVAAATAPAMRPVREAWAVILTRAQEAGAVRPDIGVDEVIALLVGASRAAEFTGWDRAILVKLLAITQDGLRPPTPQA